MKRHPIYKNWWLDQYQEYEEAKRRKIGIHTHLESVGTGIVIVLAGLVFLGLLIFSAAR